MDDKPPVSIGLPPEDFGKGGKDAGAKIPNPGQIPMPGIKLPVQPPEDDAANDDHGNENDLPTKGGGLLIVLDGPLTDAKQYTAKATGALLARASATDEKVRVLTQRDVRAHVERTQKNKPASEPTLAMSWKQSNAVWRMMQNKAKEALREGRMVIIEADVVGMKGTKWAEEIAAVCKADCQHFHITNKGDEMMAREEVMGIPAYTLSSFDKDTAALLAQDLTERLLPTSFADIMAAPVVTVKDAPGATRKVEEAPRNGGMTP